MSEHQSRILLLKQLDKVCDEFESQLESGARPSAAEFVTQMPESMRARALDDLLRIEIDQRREAGEMPSPEEYLAAFGAYREIVEKVFDDVESARDTHGPADTIDSFNSAFTSAPPVALPDYELLVELGRGAMGVVYKARQISLDRMVAVKLIHAGEFATSEQIDRFISEAKAAAKLQHPGIVAIYEVGQASGQYYFSMEFVEGRTLEELLSQRDVSQAEVARYLQAVAEAIEFAHEQGVVHRDIKPANILIDKYDRVRVMDFGLAKIVDGSSDLTASGQILGTPHYMSPEQARGEQSSIDRRTDVYSLGAVLYRSLAGRPVFESDSIAEMMAKIVRDEPQPLRKLNLNIDRKLNDICVRSLQKEPDRRFATAGEFAAELQEFIAGQKAEATHPVRQSNRGRRIGIAAMVGAVLIAATVITIKIGNRKVTVETDGDTEVEVTDGGVTIRTNGTATDALLHIPPGESALDQLRRESIDPHELMYAGGGDPDYAPEELVAVLGDSRGRQIGQILDVAISPDGKTIASVSGTSQICLWDADTMRLKNHFKYSGHRRLCYSVDSNTLVTWGWSDKLCVWKTADRPETIATVPSYLEKVETVRYVDLVYSPGSRKIATLGHDDGTNWRVRIWNCDERGVPVDEGLTIDVDDNSSALAISPDGSRFVTGTVAGKLTLWNASDDLQRIADFRVDGAKIRELAYSADGKMVAAACEKLGCKVWDVTGDKPALKHTLSRTQTYAYATAEFTPDNSHIVAGLETGSIHVWRNPAGKPGNGREIDLPKGTPIVKAIAVSPDGTRVITSSINGFLHSFDLATGQKLIESGGHLATRARVEHVSQDGTAVLTRAQDARLIRWRVRDGRIEQVAAMKVPPASGYDFDRKGEQYVFYRDYQGAPPLKLMTVGENRVFMSKELDFPTAIWELAFSPDGERVATLDENREVRLLDISSEKSVAVDQLAVGERGVSFSPDGKLLAVSREPEAGEYEIRFWDVSQTPPRHLQRLDFSSQRVMENLQFSPDGEFLAFYGNNSVGIVDVSGKEPREVYSSGAQNSFGQYAAFSPDGKMVALSVGKSPRLEIRDTRDFELLKKWDLPMPVSLKFAPDSRHLFLGNTNGTVYVLRLMKSPSESSAAIRIE